MEIKIQNTLYFGFVKSYKILSFNVCKRFAGDNCNPVLFKFDI